MRVLFVKCYDGGFGALNFSRAFDGRNVGDLIDELFDSRMTHTDCEVPHPDGKGQIIDLQYFDLSISGGNFYVLMDCLKGFATPMETDVYLETETITLKHDKRSY